MNSVRSLQIWLFVLSFCFPRVVAHAAQSASGAWSADFAMASGANGPVTAFATIGTNFYAGGEFTEIAGIHARGLAKFDGQHWSEVGGVTGGDFPGAVYALAVDGADLYVGGQFTVAGGIAATNVAKFAGDHWEALGDGVTALGQYMFASAVYALYVDHTSLYVGGRFDSAGGVGTTNVARWDGQKWNALAEGVSEPPPGSPNQASDRGRVSAFASDGTNLFVGGFFSTAGALPSTNLARWDGSQWRAMNAGLDDGLHGLGNPVHWDNVSSLAWHQNALYVGGDFQRVVGMAANGLARWDGVAWQIPATFQGGLAYPVVKALLSKADTLYVAGDFDHANGAPATNVVALKGDVIKPINAPMFLNDYLPVFALGASGDRLFLGGDLHTDDLKTAVNFVELTENGLKPLMVRIGNDVPNSSRAICTDGTNVFVAGDYGVVGTNTPLSVAKWDGSKWSTAAPPITPGVRINHVGVLGSNVFVAGDFSSKDLAVTNFACWDGQKWKNPVSANTSSVDAILTFGGKLYVAGIFSDTGIACRIWEGTNWSRVPWSVTGSQQRLATDGTDLYIARGGSSVRVGRWTGTQVIDIPVNAPLVSLSALGVAGTNILVAGSKSSATPNYNNALYRWTGSAWVEMPVNLGFAEEICAMTGFGQSIIVAGRFRNIGGVPANSVAEWNGAEWRSLDRGLTSFDGPGTVLDLAVLGNRLVLTGGFDQASRTSSGNIAMWNRTADVQFRMSSDGSGGFEVAGGSGDRVAIENSEDLATWTEVFEVELSAGGTQLGAPDSSATQKFYRARILPPKN